MTEKESLKLLVDTLREVGDRVSARRAADVIEQMVLRMSCNTADLSNAPSRVSDPGADPTSNGVDRNHEVGSTRSTLHAATPGRFEVPERPYLNIHVKTILRQSYKQFLACESDDDVESVVNSSAYAILHAGTVREWIKAWVIGMSDEQRRPDYAAGSAQTTPDWKQSDQRRESIAHACAVNFGVWLNAEHHQMTPPWGLMPESEKARFYAEADRILSLIGPQDIRDSKAEGERDA